MSFYAGCLSGAPGFFASFSNCSSVTVLSEAFAFLNAAALVASAADNGAPLSSSSFFSVSAVSGCSVGVTNGGTVSPPDGGWLRSGAVADGLILASLSNARSARS